jgi:serine/threonine protein kinase/tetratricopeptide (TPR) repeat protein
MDSDEEVPKTEVGPQVSARAERPERIGPYRLLQELGRGGMGVVYLAARADEQYEKRVALKLIKSGFDRDDVVRHFRRERQILASLEHPNIARFLDGGTTEDGLPYFVMEYVEGQRIDEYCDRRGLPTLERLKLFGPVCSALEYAHRNLIVHRDLKPGNILVGPDGVPKLLDFGIAKLLDPGTTGQTVTATGLAAMTPPYASPEQARGEPVSTASDVYSLGVVLYQLLTDQLPYRLKTLQPLDVLVAVCEEQPEKPSSAVGRTQVPEGMTARPAGELGRTHGESPDRLRRRLKGDLDTILLNALEKEPARRYSSVEAMSEDIRRYIDGLPIKARKPTLAYRTRKFLGRHWAGAAGAATAALLILGFSVSTVLQAARVRRERDKAERVSSFLVDLFEVSDPSEARGNSVTAREILDKGAERIRGELRDEPEVRATLMDTIGSVYWRLGLLDAAVPLLADALQARKRSLGAHPDVAKTMNRLGTVFYEKGDYARAEPLHREALAMQRRLLGRDDLETAKTLNNLARVLSSKGDPAGAEALLRESLAMKRKLLGNDDPQVARTLGNLAIMLYERGEYADAGPLQLEALATQSKALGSEHPDVAVTKTNLALVLAAQGDYATAETLLREALATQRRLLGNQVPAVALTLLDLALVLHEKGDDDAAEPLFVEALATVDKVLGHSHPMAADCLQGLALVRARRGDPKAALTMTREALAIAEKGPGLERLTVAGLQASLGELLVESGEPLAAEPLLREALASQRAALPRDHPDAARTESMLGACLGAQGRFAEGERLLLDSHARILAKRTGKSRETLDARARITAMYQAWGKPEKALQYSDNPVREP